MATETEIWKIDLDVKEFTEHALHAKGIIEKLGDAKNMEGLIEGLIKTSAVLGAVGVAAFGVKTAMETVFEAEDIKQINAQFENLAGSVGLVGSELKEALERASGGKVAMTDMLSAANRGMVTLGENAKSMPQLFEIARVQTKLFGGDLLGNFELINAAIATGMTKSLKGLGLKVDVTKAEIEYAKSLNTVRDALSEQEKKTALLNAVIEKGAQNQANAGKFTKEATNAWKEFGVSVKEISETFTLAFDKIAGPTVIKALQSLRDSAHSTRVSLTAFFAPAGAEKMRAEIARMEDQIKTLHARLESGADKPGLFQRILGAKEGDLARGINAQIHMIEAGVVRAKAELAKMEPVAEEKPPGSAAAGSGGAGPDTIGDAKKLLSASKLEDELAKLRIKRAEGEAKTATDIGELDIALANQRKALADEVSAAQDELRAKEALGDITAEFAAEKSLTLEADKNTKLKELDADLLNARMRALDNYAKASKTAYEGITHGFAAESQKSALQLMDFGKRGQETFRDLTKNATSSLMELGAGTKSATDVMKGFIFGFLADRAEAEGALLLASSIWPPNPVGLGAGAGLLVLAGFLRSQAGGGGKGAPVASGGSSAGPSAAATGGSSAVAEKPSLDEAKAKRGVTVQVHGNYFETEQTRRQLLEMIRQESDATDFKYDQIG